MSGVTLRQRWTCVGSHSVRIALALKAIAFEVEAAPPIPRESITDHARPPDATPALHIDGVKLTDAIAILEYIEETRADPPILPGAAGDRARVRALAQTITAGFAPVVEQRVVDHVVWLGDLGDEGRANWMRRFIARALAAAEGLLDSPSTGRFCHGDEPGLADCVLAAHVHLARRWNAPLLAFPRVMAISLRSATHPAFAGADPDIAAPFDPPRWGR